MTTSLADLLTLREMAERCPFSKRWLQERIKEGMPSQMLAGKRVVCPDEVEAWLKRSGHWRD